MALTLVDTSAVYALIDPTDQYHIVAKRKLATLKRLRTEPLLTNFTLAECHALMINRLGHHVARQWLLSNVWRIEAISAADEQTALEIISRYIDKEYSYTDATSFAVMQRLGIRRAFAFDRHFQQYGFELV
jgi:uncharacterized protein